MKRILHALAIILIVLPLLAGCGGGGGSNTPTVTGVTAAGAPLVGTVTLKDSSNPTKQLSMSPAFDGSYSFNVSGLKPPFLLQAIGTAGGNNYTFYSLALTGGNCNINPLTHLAVTMANGGQDPQSIFVAPTPANIPAVANALPAAVASIHNKLAPMFNQIGASPVNVIKDQMAANGQGIDLLFDMVSITVGNGSVSLVNKADGGTILPATSIAGGVLNDSPNVGVMSSVFTITGHAVVGEGISARSKASPYPSTPLMTAPTDEQGNYKLFVPKGNYEVCGYGSSAFNCLDVTVSNGNVTAPDFPPGGQLPFQTVEHASVGFSQIAGGIHLLRSTAAWSNFWSRLKAGFVQQPPLPLINFDENMVIAVVDSFRPTGGYGITITDVQRSPTGVVVRGVHSSPGHGCLVTQAFEQPYHIVTLPVFSGEATLNLTETVFACQ